MTFAPFHVGAPTHTVPMTEDYGAATLRYCRRPATMPVTQEPSGRAPGAALTLNCAHRGRTSGARTFRR